MGAPLPPDEEQRLEALRRYEVLDSPPEDAFDRVTRLVTATIGVPMATISLIDEHRQWYKSRVGIEVAETPREIAFCAYTILSGETMVVEDATADPRFARNPLVIGPPGIRFYAGAPIVGRDGHRLGVLCALDRCPRKLDEGRREMLRDLAAVAADELELRLSGRRLRDSEARTAAVIESLPFDVWSTDDVGRCVLQNASARDRIGDIRGLVPTPAHAEEASRWRANHARALNGEIVEHSWSLRAGNAEIEIDSIVAPLRVDGGTVGTVGLSIDVTRRNETERRLRGSEQRLQDFLAAATEWLWETDRDHRFTYVSDRVREVGADPASIVGRTRWEVAGRSPDEPAWRGHRATLDAHAPFRDFTYSVVDGDGTRHYREVSGIPVFDDAGGFAGHRGSGRNVTEREIAAAALQSAQQRLNALMSAGVIGVAFGADDLITEANDAFLRMLGYAQADLADRTFEWTALTPPDWLAYERRLHAARGTATPRPYEKEYLHRDGHRVPVLITPAFVDYATGRWMILVQDISERKQAETRIRQLAYHDPLTGLPNRRAFQERLVALEPGRLAALLVLDLDNFKDINHSLGHDAGDDVLRMVADRLRRAVRREDLVARLGGDEFAVVLDGVADAATADRIAHKLMKCLARPLTSAGRQLHVTASVGVARFPTDGEQPALLLKNADLALYRAKGQGRRAVSSFESGMRQQLEARLSLVSDLRRALSAGELCVAFQPIVRVSDGRHAGFEALVRWQHASLGLLSPAAFLPEAERSGLIVPVGRLVMQASLTLAREWREQGMDPGVLSVNLAAAQLSTDGLVEDVERWLAANRLAPASLIFEITENVLLESGEQVAPNLRRLHRMGVGIALDDFGTGYASLSHLKRFPIDVLKIDRSFVRDIGTDPEDAVIARTVVSLAHSLGMSVVAEGIETAEQLAFLRLHGCDRAQGFLFAAPIAAADVPAYLAAHAARTPADPTDEH